MNVYDWEGSDEHKAAILKAFNAEGDAHQVVATQFGITRTEAKMANWRLTLGGKPVRACARTRFGISRTVVVIDGQVYQLSLSPF